ncbi:SCO4225 family membrane protein [Streptomyces xinghaiensis]|uniref:SCO4225 family membrane protein n=1 Tax=Streptomyces xinghaiensis TaxID=1038928 RepID=UPI00341310D8
MTDTGPRRSAPRPLRGAVHAFGRVGLAYLALCAALLVWAVVVSATDDTGESMAGVIPILATAPGSLVMTFLPESAAMLIAAILFGALVNAAIIGWCTRALRRGHRPDPAH